MKLKLRWWILIGMAIGALLGAAVHASYSPEVVQASAAYKAFDGIGGIFLKLLKMVVVPLVFFSLISGMLGMGDLGRFGRIGAKTFAPGEANETSFGAEAVGNLAVSKYRLWQ